MSDYEDALALGILDLVAEFLPKLNAARLKLGTDDVCAVMNLNEDGNMTWVTRKTALKVTNDKAPNSKLVGMLRRTDLAPGKLPCLVTHQKATYAFVVELQGDTAKGMLRVLN